MIAFIAEMGAGIAKPKLYSVGRAGWAGMGREWLSMGDGPMHAQNNDGNTP